MTTEDLRQRINANLQAVNAEVQTLLVDRDAYGGWRIIIVSPYFEGKLPNERQAAIQKAVENLQVEWLELLTPAEREWAGALPLNGELEQLPLWPQALAKQVRDKPLFPSQLDDDLELPITVTFYSLRGGVGRSTALAYTGAILSRQGRKVICIDLDLEAPGLPALFGKETQVKEDRGLVHLLLELDKGNSPDVAEHLIRIDESEDLYCLPAGKPNASYARLLSLIDPAAWYREERNPLRELMRRLRENLPFKPDVILLDSRTGISPISAPLLFDLADISIVAFFPHPQTETGTGALVRALLAAKTRREREERLTPEPRFIVTPIPSARVPEVVKRYQHRAVEWISKWLATPDVAPQVESNLFENEITHFIPYKESIASSDQVLQDQDVWKDYSVIADWIERFLPSLGKNSPLPSVGASKTIIIDELQFSGGTAETQADLLATFVETDVVKRALGTSPLILGRKGTGKTAIFRRLSEDKHSVSVIITTSTQDTQNLLSSEGFQAIERFLTEHQYEWRLFWLVYINYVVYSSLLTQLVGNQNLQFTLPATLPATEREMVEAVKTAMSLPDAGLLARDSLRALDVSVQVPIRLLFDGLDTGFGSGDQDRRRRKSALEGLFSLYLGVGELKKISFKILLREDIWTQLQFENKSHFFGKTETLKWNDQVSLLRVAIKQALRSKTFNELVKSFLPTSSKAVADIAFLSDEDVLVAWNLLVGERMKGGNTTFTRNWVWNRLADANGDHSPRYLIQLLDRVTEWEKRENQKNAYDKSILRPRGLIEVFPVVSNQALSALRDEEFQELAPLMEKLTQVGRTPLDRLELSDFDNLLKLARDVGLLGIYEGSEESVDRFKVPELFRHALKMSRRGQA